MLIILQNTQAYRCLTFNQRKISKGKGRASKQVTVVRSQKKGKVAANKRVRMEIEVEDKTEGSESDNDSEDGGETRKSVGEKGEKPVVSWF